MVSISKFMGSPTWVLFHDVTFLVCGTKFIPNAFSFTSLTVKEVPFKATEPFGAIKRANSIGASNVNLVLSPSSTIDETVAIPSTLIPLIICSFFAYALSWMKFFGRDTLLAIIIASLVVPLQMSLIPILTIYNDIGALFGVAAKSYPGVWMAHTGFGLASTTFLLRNFIKSLPNEIAAPFATIVKPSISLVLKPALEAKDTCLKD